MGFWHLSDSDLIDYADGGAGAGRQAAAHLAQCRRCTDRLARVCEVSQALQCMSSAAVPVGLRHRVARALREESALEMSCEQAAPLLQECLDGCLSPFAAVALQQHLHICAKCQTDLKALAAVMGSVQALPVVASAAGVRARVREASLRATPPVARRLGWRPVMAAAAAFLLLGALSLLRPAPLPQTDSQPLAPRIEARVPDAVPVEVVSLPASEAALADEEAAREAAAGTAIMEQAGEVSPRSAPMERANVRLAGTLPKGPAPALVTLRSSEPSVAMPAAFAALKAVKAASDEAAVQRAMEQAGERFATLRSEELSEATLVQLPSVASGPPSEVLPSPRSGSAPLVAPKDPEGLRGEPSGSATREGASLLAAPFV